MIGQIAKETILVNSTEVEKEKVAGGVKLNFTQAVKTQLGQIATNTASIVSLGTAVNNQKKFRKTVTLATSGWSQNQSTGLYEQTVVDADVTANHLIEVIMDLANQAKLTDGYVESLSGSYKFYTSVLPTENITATVVFELTEEIVPDVPGDDQSGDGQGE